jgi:gliding motility-associated-like protein
MRKFFTSPMLKYVFAGLAMCIGFSSASQTPTAVSTNISGTYVDVSLINYGLFGQYKVQAASSSASGVDIVEFPEYVNQFYNVWRSYSPGLVLAGYNIIIPPTGTTAGANWNSNAGGSSILLPAIDSGNYYTINVMTNQGYANDTMAILETTYYPDSFVSMSIPVDTNEVGPSCSPTIVAVLAAAPSAGEYIYLRYSVNGFADSSSVILMTVSGDTATCQIPAYPAGTNIQYYALSTPNALIATGPASGYYDCQTLNLITGSIGNNFRYTVKTLPVPSVSITASADPVCSGIADTFTAHGVNTGTVPAGYQWYKNGGTVGTNDSIYIDATLNNNDSVWVVMTANLGCPAMDTSNHIIITVNPLPTGTVGVVSPAICYGDSAIIFITPSDPLDSVEWYTAATGGFPGFAGDTLAGIPPAGADSAYAQLISPAGCVNTTLIPAGVTVYPLAAFTQSISFCAGDSIIVGAHTYDTSGRYIDTLYNASANGCDSIVNTILTVYPPAAYTQYDTICQGGSVMVGAVTHDTAGTFIDTLVNASATGCDSIVTTNLYVNPLAAYTQYDTICQGGTVMVGAVTHDTAGTFIDTLVNASATGCDSIVTTNLYVNAPPAYTQYDTICLGSSFTENGHTYTMTNTYMDTFTNASVTGCDSIVTTNLYVTPPPSYIQYDTICLGSSFTENGHAYTTTNMYMDTFTNASVTGCDSIVTTNLYVTPPPAYTQYDTICLGSSFTENGHAYTTTNTYMDTFTNASVTGCDSIVTTNLYVTPPPAYTQYDTICLGSSFTENGHIYTTTNTYVDTFTNASVTGCDSIVTTNLYVYPLATYTQYDTICQGGNFTENGHTYTTTNTYVDTFTNASVTGCDSIVTTNLYVYPLATYTQYDTICQSSSFIENGHTYTTTNMYMDTFTNASVTGCDSIVTTNLYVYPLATYTQYDTVCQGGSFTENGHIYTTTNTYIDTFTNASVTGCDSIVTTNLTVNPLAAYTQYDTICQGGSFTENGHTYTTTNTYVDTFTNASVTGCDSIVTTDLTVNPLAAYTQYDTICQGSSFTENGHIYTTTNTYMDTFYNASVTGCDSIVTTDLYVIPSATYTQYDTICQSSSFTENGHTYTTTNTYIDTFYNASATGCDSIVTTNLYVNPTPTVNPVSNQQVCNKNLTAPVNFTGAVAGTVYNWTGSNSAIGLATSGAGDIPSFIAINAGSTAVVDTIIVTPSYTNGGAACTGAPDTFTITVNPSPVMAAPADQAVCNGQTTTAVTFTSNVLGTAYTWAGSDSTIGLASGGSGDIASFVAINPTAADVIDTITVTPTSPQSCIGMAVTFHITVHPVPQVNLGPNVTQCGGNVAIDAGNAGSTYLWSDNNTTEIDTISTSGTYTVTVTTTYTCTASGSKTVYIKTAPVVNLGPPQTTCADSVVLDAGNPGNAYLWTGGSTMQFLTVYSSGTYTVTVTDTASGCSSSDSVQVVVGTKPVITLGNDTATCNGPVILSAAGANGINYIWSNGDTTSVDTVTATGNYSVTVTSVNGCTASGSVLVTVYPKPSLGPDVTDSICPGSTADLYNYYINSGLALTYGSPTPAGVDTGTYTIIGTNSNGCTDTALVTIAYRPKPVVTTAPISSLCTGAASIDLIPYFTPAGGTFAGPGVSGNFFYPNLAAPGNDSVTYYYTNSYGCMDTAGNTIVVIPSVKVVLHTAQSNFTICQGQPITFTSSGATLYQFFVNDSVQGPADTINTFTTTALNNHDQVYVIGSNSCSSDTSDYMIIDVVTPPAVSAGQDTTITLGQSVMLQGTASGASALIYFWSPDSFLSVTNTPNPVYSGPDTIRFELKVTDTYGCTDSAFVTVNVMIPDDIQLPNVITPNGDGKNDVWALNPKIDLAGSHLVIFDRWGEIVYETYNYNNDWGGTYKSTGHKVPDGTYYYVLTVPAQDNQTYKGPINVLSSSGQ